MLRGADFHCIPVRLLIMLSPGPGEGAVPQCGVSVWANCVILGGKNNTKQNLHTPLQHIMGYNDQLTYDFKLLRHKRFHFCVSFALS